MKKKRNLYEQIIDMDNLRLAEQKASKGKSRQHGVKQYMKNQEANLWELHLELYHKTYVTSPYTVFLVFEPKKRMIYRLPFRDRIVHHAIMNIMEAIWVSLFTADTYSCIKGRGVHSAGVKIREALKNEPETRYCLKLDITKFYPSVDHRILKQIIRMKVKDQDLLQLLDGIIDSAEGLPIGNYLSQYLANLYLTYFDHWLKEVMKVKNYFRYCDDMVIFSGSKSYLHQILADIRLYLEIELKLTVKGNYQIFPVAKRGVDFLGYRFFHTHTLLRKSIKKNFARAVARRKSKATIDAYMGWAKHANCLNLNQKLLSHERNKEVQPAGYSANQQRI